MITPFEGVCLAVVGLHLARSRRRGEYLALAAGAWLGEDTVIRAYGFYAYTPGAWALWLDRVPLLVVLIWPVVIQTARQLARALRPDPRAAGRLAAGIVLADAAFIEPVAVDAGLWHWTHPGPFQVPPIGVIGWALFALPWLAGPDRLRRRPALGVLVAPAFTHLALLLLWWGLFRWIDRPVPDALAAGLGLLVAAGVAGAARRRALPLSALLTRAPAAAIFFALLLRSPTAGPALWAWALAGALPYLVLLAGHLRPAPT